MAYAIVADIEKDKTDTADSCYFLYRVRWSVRAGALALLCGPACGYFVVADNPVIMGCARNFCGAGTKQHDAGNRRLL